MEETTARAATGRGVPRAAAAALVRNRGGRPAGSMRKSVTLRVDRDVLARWRASGAGWQSRMNEALRRGAVMRPTHACV
ncbi:BrnA antitoxin family protein [Sphingomonas sp. RIT328]|uniref:BrnA antitoxin family protein n=1 Tax=Sphingomonas sp. RIT328 TaxID=1470591 RepID=UPI00056921A9|nr:BrnA antitoxin family protein [Sphingomonas sp. RIT328]